ncbi:MULTISPECIES: lipoprotein-releasing ABC transporter permease subunit [Colwellia]|jgi:lipoprotein-releasing system permease protein|uniref:Lipoprotein releasing system transmembrane protein LolC n=1 Tax=Colwellia psychrerythraea (strain 34H / ATCC BAA-681) TaxID=167879 RepID=Q47YG7_COLP3|nr:MULTISPECIES: lipoprotein-releasing ABC transporter permease subunit [Colwellia]AAZ25386.1 lipoprotein releasing system transmembrane protein LolC [Colwellia psychrerythraea 34H]PKH86861.1 lipoprotein-releasing system transmembrane subunit, LolC/LolE family [Colwellia sp. Bg11-28]
MFQPISIFIGLRYSRSKSHTGFVSFITFFSTVGILLGVAALITVVSVMNGFEGELKKRILGIVPHVIVSDFSTIDTGTDQEKSWQNLREELLTQPNVLRVTPFLESEALIQSTKGLQGVLVQGIMPKFEQKNIVSTHMVAGSMENLSTQSYSLVLGQSLANKLQVSLGDEVRLVLPNKSVFTPMGRIPVQRVFTVAGIFHIGSQVDDAMVYVDSRYGAKLLRRTGDGIDKLRLYLDDAFNAKTVVKNLEQKQQNTEHSKTLDSINFSTWDESQGALFSAVKMEKNMMWLMLSLIVAVAAFNIVSALVMVVVEKQAEIGILQTLGLARIEVIKIFITQGMVNGLWGVSLGGLLGVILALNLNSILLVVGVNLFGFGMQDLPIKLEWFDVLTIILSALAMSFLATLYPAYQASTTQPAQVLRNE